MKSYRPYTAAEIAAIQARYPTEGSKKLAKELGRSPRGIRAKAWTMGLAATHYLEAIPGARPWTEEEDLKLRREWPAIIARSFPGHNARWLAKQFRDCSVNQLRVRTAKLGLRHTLEKPRKWTEQEIELLHKVVHLTPKVAVQHFRRAGFHRTETALAVARARYGVRVSESTEAYSAQGLARMMGVTTVATIGWIKRGWLKATPRSSAIDPTHGGVGDRWLIYPRDVRRFIQEYIGHLNLVGVDKYWLVELLCENVGKLEIQHSCGVKAMAAGGLDEYEVSA